MRKILIGSVAAIVLLTPQIAPTVRGALAAPAASTGPVVKARASEPVVISGANIPTWSRNAPTGQAAPYPSGSPTADGGDGTRSAHNGVLTVPPDTRTGVNPEQIAAYRWTGGAWAEIPVQVDQMFPNYLANGHSSFGVYSGTDEEVTYAWNPTAHSIGEESWKKVFGGTVGVTASGYTDPTPCGARYQQPGANGAAELAAAKIKQTGQNFPVVSEPTDPTIPPDDYTQAMQDPVNALTGTPQLDDATQIAMMAGDAGLQAPSGTPQPIGTFPNNGQQITVVDPTSSSDGSAAQSYIYLFLQPGGSSFTWQNGYVQMTRSANADEWIDRNSFAGNSTEKIGSSNTGYGPNIGGNVCRTAPGNDSGITTPDGTARPSADRAPRDSVTITTQTYRVYASGRWMVRELNVTAPNTHSSYGPNLISRWKGRAFQSSPDSSVSLVGFEDEQVNWEQNDALLGWKIGPVRAIREIWGADSGTNVTKTEIYYRDAFTYQYHVRVHPIPPDGLYTSWDMRYGYDTMYYNQLNAQGVPIDGTNSHNVGEVDQVPVSGQPAFFNSCDPSHDICTVIDNPEEVAGPNGAMVFAADILPSHLVSNVPSAVPDPSTVLHPAAVPFYRDDACFDDGTGDAPVPRPQPGEATTDSRVEQGYVDYWSTRGLTPTGNLATDYAQLHCQPPTSSQAGYQQPGFGTYQTMPFQGAIGEIGVHYFFTADSDNAFTGIPLSELDAETWVYPVPLSTPENLISATTSATGRNYGLNVQTPLQTVVTPFSAPAATSLTTAVIDDASNAAWANSEVAGASAHDTANIGGQQSGQPATGTVTYSFFKNGTCSGSATSTQTVTVSSGGSVPNSASTGALTGTGSYAFRAAYSGDANYGASTSPCEPFAIQASWTLQATPNPSGATVNGLYGVACPSSTVCVAVGSDKNTSNVTVTLAERWNGSSWAIQATPNPAGALGSALLRVACTSASACTAVGYDNNSANVTVTLAERWNGTAWTVQATPNPAGAMSSVLNGIACTSATSCAAVGNYVNSAGVTLPLAESWNGTSWSVQSAPVPSGAQSGVLSGVACSAAAQCTAVGNYASSTGKRSTLAERWNGSAWSVQSTPNPTGAKSSQLVSVACPSTTVCVANGTYANSAGTTVTLAERWNGTSWSVQATPNPSGATATVFYGIACASTTACAGVGAYTNSSGVQVTLAERWNGTSWVIQSTPNPSGAKASALAGVACPSTALCTAVWYSVNSASLRVTLAERYS